MLSTVKIDWFTGVSKYAKAHPFPLSQDNYVFVPHKGWSGYDVGERELSTDIKRYSSTTRGDMGCAIVISGGALERLAKMDTTGDLLAKMWSDGLREYRCSRLDLAIDIYDGGLLAHKVARAARRDVIKTSARTISVIEQQRGGQGITTYIGTRKSARFIRVYDKNAESGGRIAASRFELQANKEFAAELWRGITEPDQTRLNAIAYAAIAGLVSDWGDESANEQMQFIVSSKPAPKPEPSDDDWNWIAKQVLPTLSRDFYLNGEGQHTLLHRLTAAIKRGEVE